MQIRQHLSAVGNVLIPFRHNSRHNKIPSLLAERLTAGDKSKSGNKLYYEFFADALFFTDPSGFDRIGAFHAFAGLEEILNSAFDLTNSSLDIKRQTIKTLEEFKSALEEHDNRTLSPNCFRARPEKQNNIITYYLSATRNYFLPSDQLIELFSENAERIFTVDELFVVKKYFRQREALLYSEPAAGRLNAAIKQFAESESKEEISFEIRRLGRFVISNLNERWRKTCLIGYGGTRQGAEARAPTQEKLISRSDKTAWAVAAAMSFLPASAIEKEDVLSVLPRGAIADALRLCFSSRKYDWKTADQIGRISWFVTQGEIYYWRTKWRGKRRRRPPRRNSGGRKKNDDPSPAEILESENIWTDEINLQTEEGAAPDELEVSAEAAVVEKSPRGSSSESKAFRLTHDEASWGRSRLTDETIGVVWAWLRSRAENNPNDTKLQSSLLFVELLIFFGFPPDFLLTSQLRTDTTYVDETARLIFTADSVTIFPARPGDKPAFAAPLIGDLRPYYVPSELSFALPLPKPLRERIRALLEQTVVAGEPVFLFQAFAGELSAVRKTVNEIFKPLKEIIGEKVTINKLAKAVRTLLREEGTLSALEIALVAGEIPHQTASPMFYSNYKVSELREKYCASIEQVIARIIQSSRDYLDYLEIPPLDFNFGKRLFPESEDDHTDGEEDARLGSPFVPKIELLNSYLCRLTEGARETNDLVLRHNRLTALTTIALMSLTGLRPLELSFLTNQHLELHSDNPSLAVTAKINQKHSEWRTLELAPETVKLLLNYRELSLQVRNHQKLLTQFTRREIDARLGDHLFFFLRRTLAPVKLSTRGLGNLVRQESYLEAGNFPWKLNAPRHLYRTTAIELDVPEKIINSLMGHQTTGAESIGLFSAADRAEETFYACRISTEICRKLNLNYAA